VLVSAEVFYSLKAKSYIKTLGVVVQNEDHVAQRLTGIQCLINQALQQCGTDAAILKLRQEGNVQEADMFVVSSDPDPSSGLLVDYDHAVIGIRKAGRVLGSL
jgi:hypothetical protein